MKNYSPLDPTLPYYGTALDNEVIASNLVIIEDDFTGSHYSNNDNTISSSDEIIASTITDNQVDYCFAVGGGEDVSYSNTPVFEDEVIELEIIVEDEAL